MRCLCSLLGFCCTMFYCYDTPVWCCSCGMPRMAQYTVYCVDCCGSRWMTDLDRNPTCLLSAHRTEILRVFQRTTALRTVVLYRVSAGDFVLRSRAQQCFDVLCIVYSYHVSARVLHHDIPKYSTSRSKCFMIVGPRG